MATNVRSVRALTIVALIIGLSVPGAAQSSADWRRMVEGLKTGTRLELQLEDGTRVQGTLMFHDADALVLNPRTRIPVSPWRVAYAEIRSVDVKQSGALTPGAKVLIGLGAGAAVFLVTMAIIVAAIDD